MNQVSIAQLPSCIALSHSSAFTIPYDHWQNLLENLEKRERGRERGREKRSQEEPIKMKGVSAIDALMIERAQVTETAC